MIYLDNAATTAVAPFVSNLISDTMKKHFGNPSSLYNIGGLSEKIIDNARAQLAKALGCSAYEVYFTASGTEGNNIAIYGAALARKTWGQKIVCTGYEHPSVYMPLENLRNYGFDVVFIKPDISGNIDEQALLAEIDEKTVLATFMHVNNEIGTVIDVKKLAAQVKAKNRRTAVHVDGVQAFMRLEFKLGEKSDIDSYAVSGHKVHVPKGVGALYVRRGHNLAKTLLGGGQERGLRPGTENIPYIAGFGAAAEHYGATINQRYAAARELNDVLRKGLLKHKGLLINSPEKAIAHVLNFSAVGLKSEVLLHFFEAQGIYVSSGSACSKGAASHTLVQMGLPAARIDGAVRVSFSDATTVAHIKVFLAALNKAYETLARV